MKRLLFLASLVCLSVGGRTPAREPPTPRAILGPQAWRHDTAVVGLCFRSDGKVLASAMADQSIRLWDAATGKERYRFVRDGWPVIGLHFSADERTLILTGFHSVRLWEVATGEERAEVGERSGWTGPIAASPDGRMVAHRLGLADLRVRLSALPTGKLIRSLEGHTAPVQAVAFSPDGKTLATASEDRTIRLWDVAAGKQRQRWTSGHNLAVGSLVFSPDGKRLASMGQGDHTLRVWTEKGNNVAKLTPLLLGSERGLAFSPNGKILALTEPGGWVRLWDVSTSKDVRRFWTTEQTVGVVAFSPDGKTLATGTLQGPIRLWNPDTGEEKNPTKGGHRLPITGLVYSPDGKTLATLSRDETIRFWDVAGRKELRAITDCANQGTFAAFSPNGLQVASLGKDQRAVVWHADTLKESWKTPMEGVNTRPWALAFSPDGQCLAVAQVDGKVRLYDTSTHKAGGTFLGLRTRPTALVFSPDGRFLAGSTAGVLYLWDVKTQQGRSLPFDSRNPAIGPLIFSPDSRLLAAVGTASHSPTWLFETTTAGARIMLPGHFKGTRAAAFSPDGRILATGGMDSELFFIDLATGAVVQCVQHPGPVTAIAFRSDGKELATGSTDTLVRIWDPANLLPARRPAMGKKLTDEALETLLADLGSEQPGKAGEGMRRLASEPAQAVDFFRRRTEILAGARIQKLIAELDSDEFATRERASSQLEKLGPVIVGPLRTELEGKVSAEVRRRLEKLLVRFKNVVRLEGSTLQADRIVELLDRLGTEEACKLLQKWTKDLPKTELGRLAKDALRRQERLRETRR